MSVAGAFILGLLSSAHCIGMCGGFAAAIGVSGRPFGRSVCRQLIYSTGRIFTYGFLGALAGSAGLYLSQFDSVLVGVQQGFSILAGVLMLAIGASILGLLRFRWTGAGALGNLIGPLYRRLLASRTTTGLFLAGLANGFLPCGLVYAMVTTAASTASMTQGMALMAGFGAGTVPAMVAMGCGGMLLSHSARGRVYRVAACLVMLAGAITIWRALPSSDHEHCVKPGVASTETGHSGWPLGVRRLGPSQPSGTRQKP